jgi:hypothetical protein
MKHLKILEDFVNEGAFHVALYKARNEGATEFEFKGKKFPVHPKKGETEDKVEESTINEGAVKQFEADIKEVINQVKRGMGWIDPSYIEETWNEIASSVDFSVASEEIVNRLIKAGIVYQEDGDGEKGKQAKNYKEISSLLESKVPAEIKPHEVSLFNTYKNFAIRTGSTPEEAEAEALKSILNARVISKEMDKIGYRY